MERPLEQSEKLAAEDSAEHLDGQEESILGMNPARVAWIETAGGNDAVEVSMAIYRLSGGPSSAGTRFRPETRLQIS
jgi:hypothetical protein